ncbi:hypothetical protein [Enterococcus asini]|uniref:hypothetical protein n=1 Tax=Enterococcus asini TaxID=57732 RepID=UPI0022E727EE|nr:hypothetical protein [Enterococcus asini]
MKGFLLSIFAFNKGSVLSKKDYHDLYQEIEKYKRSEFDYEYSKAKSTLLSYDKIYEVHSSVILASAFASLFTLAEGSPRWKIFSAFTILTFVAVRISIYFILPRISMKVDIFEAILRNKWKK